MNSFVIFVFFVAPHVYSSPVLEPVIEPTTSHEEIIEKVEPLLNDVGIIVIDGDRTWVERDRGDYGESRWSNRDRWTEDRRQGSTDRRTEWEVEPEVPRRGSSNRRKGSNNNRRTSTSDRITPDRVIGNGEDADEVIWEEDRNTNDRNSNDRKPQGSRERGSSQDRYETGNSQGNRERGQSNQDRYETGSDRREALERWGDQDPWRRGDKCTCP